jgi:hypothetical protein
MRRLPSVTVAVAVGLVTSALRVGERALHAAINPPVGDTLEIDLGLPPLKVPASAHGGSGQFHSRPVRDPQALTVRSLRGKQSRIP